jgi:hypothetical protein
MLILKINFKNKKNILIYFKIKNILKYNHLIIKYVTKSSSLYKAFVLCVGSLQNPNAG